MVGLETLMTLTAREWTEFTPLAREGQKGAPRLGHWVCVTDSDPHARGEMRRGGADLQLNTLVALTSMGPQSWSTASSNTTSTSWIRTGHHMKPSTCLTFFAHTTCVLLLLRIDTSTLLQVWKVRPSNALWKK